jgi:hypothetical protein
VSKAALNLLGDVPRQQRGSSLPRGRVLVDLVDGEAQLFAGLAEEVKSIRGGGHHEAAWNAASFGHDLARVDQRLGLAADERALARRPGGERHHEVRARAGPFVGQLGRQPPVQPIDVLGIDMRRARAA